MCDNLFKIFRYTCKIKNTTKKPEHKRFIFGLSTNRNEMETLSVIIALKQITTHSTLPRVKLFAYRGKGKILKVLIPVRFEVLTVVIIKCTSSWI
jgi:thioredoxin reductase